MFKMNEATAHDDYLLKYEEITRKLNEFQERLELHRMKSKQHYSTNYLTQQSTW
jgi:hypothetical protein